MQRKPPVKIYLDTPFKERAWILSTVMDAQLAQKLVQDAISDYGIAATEHAAEYFAGDMGAAITAMWSGKIYANSTDAVDAYLDDLIIGESPIKDCIDKSALWIAIKDIGQFVQLPDGSILDLGY